VRSRGASKEEEEEGKNEPKGIVAGKKVQVGDIHM
jgi:hypothetical protein